MLFQNVNDLIQQVNQLVPNKNLKKNISETLDVFYQAYDILSQVSSQRETADQRKWEIIQLNRSSQLKAQLQDQYSMNYSIPKEVLAREKQLKDSLEAKISSMEPGTLDSSLFVMKRAYDDFIIQLEQDYPRYAQLKTEEDLSELAELRAQINPDERILAFFEGQEQLFLMSISRDEVISKSMDKQAIYEQIAQFNAAIFTHSLPELITLSAELRSAFLLDSEAIAGISHLNLAPDGDIWKLDFGSLPASEFGEDAFLMRQLTFSYDLLLEDFDPLQRQGSEEVVAFSYAGLDEAKPSTSSILFRDLDSNLPGTSEEVKAISEIWDGRYYYSNLATETVFKNEARQSEASAILHLALHGYQDDIYPENSFLKFATEDSLNDGRLHSYELYNLRLEAPLAVLSACNSGSGKVEAGEGMVSLGRAFAYAGVQSILATRWKVPDHTAPVIMEHFYRGLKKGMKKSEALQFAQQQYLQIASNVEKAPFFWAGYYILGNDEPIVNAGLSRSWVTLLGLLLVIAGYFTWRRRG